MTRNFDKVNMMNNAALQILDKTHCAWGVKVMLGVMLLAICAQIRIPIQPVPVTLQTAAVLLVGYTFAPRQALTTVLLYIMLALVGAPITSDMMGGMQILFKPSLGYLLGFIPAAYFLAHLKPRAKTFFGTVFLGVIANCIILTCGVGYLSFTLGLVMAIKVGLLPFMLPGLVKTLMLCSWLKMLRNL
jgi:biotin transport system substrate-specific component